MSRVRTSHHATHKILLGALELSSLSVLKLAGGDAAKGEFIGFYAPGALC